MRPRFLITLLFCSHILACFWGLLGRYSIKLNCSDENTLVSYDVGENYILTSWIIQLHEAKDSPATRSQCTCGCRERSVSGTARKAREQCRVHRNRLKAGLPSARRNIFVASGLSTGAL